MKERKYVLGALVACLVIGGCDAGGTGGGEAGQEGRRRSRSPGSTRARTTTAAGRRRTTPGAWHVQKVLGAQVQTTYKDKVFSNAQVPQIVAGLVRDGYKMIFGDLVREFELGVNGQLYAKYPNVLFEQATGTQIKKNQSEYFGAAEDTIYLSGMAAGAATKKGVIGYVVPYGIPEVVRHINAFTLGAQATHPGAKVKIVWTNEWYSPPKETAAAKALVAAGVDVIGQNVDSPAAGVYAEKAGDPVGRLRLRREEVRAEAVADGLRLRLGPVLRPPRQGGDERHLEAGLLLRLGQGRLHERSRRTARSVSAKTKAAIAAKRQQIVSGKWHSFCGPIYDQGGKLKIAKGKCLDPNTKAGIDALYSMQWLVKGVLGSVSHVPPPG